MIEEALLLTRGAVQLADRNIGKLLGFFGVPWSAQAVQDFIGNHLSSPERPKQRRVFTSAAAFLDVVTELERSPERMRRWQHSVHSVFVYGDDRTVLQKLSQALGGDEVVVVSTLWRGSWNFAVHDYSKLCGPMAGTRIRVSNTANSPALAFYGLNSNVQKIISADNTAVFIQLEYHGVTIFISTSMEIVDVDAELAGGIFDIREHLFTALPVVLYVKWAFALSSWQSREANACLMIDDPLLKQRHGFVDFHKLLLLMKRHNFCTNIAFIPWNWRRTDPDIAQLFRENREYYSVSLHGCDHNRAEFGSNDLQLLYTKSQQALRRMASHRRATGIEHEPVMVFPHGAFSEAALLALRHTEFIGAAGNESISKDVVPSRIRVSDVWDVAIMCYGNFPIYTRRSPHEGIENVAFDLLLGKPALISIHHDFCRDNYLHLTAFVDLVNALKVRPKWCSLGEIMKRSCRQRETSRGTVEIEMFAREIYIENSSDYPKRFVVIKREFDPTAIRVIRTEVDRLSWNFSGDRVQFEIDLDPGQNATIHLDFHELGGFEAPQKSVAYRVGTVLRRYACELRDNYVITEKLPLPARLRDVFLSDSEELVTASNLQTNGDFQSTAANKNSRDAIHAVSAKKMLGLLPDRVSEAIKGFTEWLQRYGETSWDHQSFYAGAVGGKAKSIYYRNKLLGTLAVTPMVFFEGFIPSARRLFHHRIRLPIADAHYAMGFAFLCEGTRERRHFERATHFLEELKRSRCPGFEEYCWGYPFEWVTRTGTIRRDVPLVTTTPYVYEAFLQMFQLEPRREWKEILASIARHAACDIKSFKTSAEGSSSSYTPFDRGGVVNAAAYRAFLLTSASQFFSNTEYLEIAERNVNFVLETQNPDGSWFYAVDSDRDFVDHFHTCFVLKALTKIYRLTGDERLDEALEKGVHYYVCNLFDEDGLPKPFSKAPRLTVYKRELYDCAECINVCLLLRSRFPDLEKILTNVIVCILDKWVKSDGSFRSRQLHFGWDNLPMHRWGQSQMFRSLAFYFAEETKMRGKRDQTSEIRKRLSQVKEQNSSVDSNADQKSEDRGQMSAV